MKIAICDLVQIPLRL